MPKKNADFKFSLVPQKHSVFLENGGDGNNGEREKSPSEILRELDRVDSEIENLSARHNILLRDLRRKVGKSFRHDGKMIQIKKRGSKYYLAEFSGGTEIPATVKKLG